MAWLELKEIKPGNRYWYLRVPIRDKVRSIYLGKERPSSEEIYEKITRLKLQGYQPEPSQSQ
jgi:hypothetical protein